MALHLVSYTTRKVYQFQLLLTRNQFEEANKAVAKVLEWKMVQQMLWSIFLVSCDNFAWVHILQMIMPTLKRGLTMQD